MRHVPVTDLPMQFNEDLIKVLDFYYKANKKKFDCCIMVDGPEGIGKTNVAMSLAYYFCYKSGIKFTLDNVVFTVDQAIEAIDRAKPMEVIVWDEFVFGGMAQDALTSMQQILIKKFTTIRKKRLFLILCIPFIFMVRKYFCLARTRALIHMTSPDGLKRGGFSFYGYSKKKYLYINGYKYWNYKIKPNFRGHFHYNMEKFMDVDAYEKKKDEAIQNIQIRGYKKDDEESKSGIKLKCDDCGSMNIKYSFLKNVLRCMKCGNSWSRDKHTEEKISEGKEKSLLPKINLGRMSRY